jgi:argininosuccinate lyase
MTDDPSRGALWSGRFDTAPHQGLFDYGASFGIDRQLFEDDVEGSMAWAEALEGAGVLSLAERDALTGCLALLLDESRRDPRFVSGPDEDVHSFVERQLVERLGDLGRRLHTGRSRNEQVSLDLRLYLRRRIPALQRLLAGLIEALADQAERAGESLMPSYTHLRPAQPVLVAHFLLAHAAALRRDHARLGAAAADADAMPLGSGAIAGTSYRVDVHRLADRLGFSRVVDNSIDASSDRDFVATFLFACALAMVHVSRLAEDLVIFSGEEHGFFELSDAASTGSSMMPQKKNPDPLELARGKAGRTIGHLTAWLATLKGLPSGYNKDLQEDKEATFDAEMTLAMTLEAVTAVVATMTVHGARAAAAAAGLALATDAADYLVRRGVPFRRAHEVVGAIVRFLLKERRDFSSLSPAEWRRFDDRFGEDIVAAVTPEASVARRETPQSTRPEAVRQALAGVRAWLAEQARAARPAVASRDGVC